MKASTDPAENGPNVSVVAPNAAPGHRSIYLVQVAPFLKARERYELEMSSKQPELATLKALPYCASIDRTLLTNLVFMRKCDNFIESELVSTGFYQGRQPYICRIHSKTYGLLA